MACLNPLGGISIEAISGVASFLYGTCIQYCILRCLQKCSDPRDQERLCFCQECLNTVGNIDSKFTKDEKEENYPVQCILNFFTNILKNFNLHIVFLFYLHILKVLRTE